MRIAYRCSCEAWLEIDDNAQESANMMIAMASDWLDRHEMCKLPPVKSMKKDTVGDVSETEVQFK